MKINENTHAFLNLFGVISKLQLKVTSQLEARSKSEIAELRARELKTMLVVARLSLLRHRGLGLKELADYINVPVPSMSLLVSALVDKDLLCRETDPGNRRRVVITLSQRGRGMVEAMLPELSRCVDELLYGFDDGERRSFISLVNRLYLRNCPDVPEKSGVAK